LVGAVQELGRLTAVATPVIDAVLGLIKERARAAGLYGELATL
jgi:2-dehydropantoate 2-reductase